jgi:dTDP-4-amino-4,6-dideoxygalactose transaminase
VPVHQQPAFVDVARCVEDLAHTDSAAREVLSLPMFAELSDRQVLDVADAVRTFASAPATAH